MQLAIRFQSTKSVPHTDENLRLNIKTAMCREHPLDRKCRHSLKRSKIGSRVSGGVIGKQCVFVDQIAGKKIAAIFLPKAHMSRRMSGSMQHLNAAASDINYVVILQRSCWSTLKKLILVYIITFRQLTAVDYHTFDLLHSQRKFAAQPIQFILMSVKIRKIFVTSDMIPMDVGGNGSNRFVR